MSTISVPSLKESLDAIQFAILDVVVATMLTACDSGGRSIPLTGGANGRQEISIAYLNTLYSGAPTQIDGEFWISGQVVSSDRWGNFYHTLVIEDDTGGIEILLDTKQIFKIFEQFSLVRVRCNGLWLGSNGGTLQLGDRPGDGYQTGPLPIGLIAEHLIRDGSAPVEKTPRILTFSQMEPRHISTLVAFRGVRFSDDEQGLAWAETGKDAGGEDSDAAGEGADGSQGGDGIPSATNRHLIDSEGNVLVVRTSRYAEFAHLMLPGGEGTIEGVLSVFGSEYQLTVTDANKFYPARRCTRRCIVPPDERCAQQYDGRPQCVQPPRTVVPRI